MSRYISYLCVCMRDVISEFNSEIEGSLAFCSDVVSVLYFVSYVFCE